MAEPHTHVFQIFIRTTPEKLWQALTDSEFTQQYFFGSVIKSNWTAGSPYSYVFPTGELMIEGEILEIDPPHKLVTTFSPRWDPYQKTGPKWKVSWGIAPTGEACKLTLIHEGLEAGSSDAHGTFNSWSLIISQLKSVLETGKPMDVGTPEM